MNPYDAFYRSIVFPRRTRSFAPDVYARIDDASQLMQSPQLEQITLAQLRELVSHAVEKIPFWQERFRAAGVDPRRVQTLADLSPIPVLEKGEVRAHGPLMVLPETSLSMADMTGGSTAAPMQFFRDPECLASRVANEWAFFRWYGRRPWHRWAHIWGAQRDLGETASLKARLRSQLLDRAIVLPANKLSEPLIDEFLGRMSRFRPKFIHAYSQGVYLVARRMLETGTSIEGIEAVTVTAEPIYPDQRSVVERAFGCRTYSIYGTREFGMIAAESPVESGLHVNPLNALVEVLLPDGTPAPPGVPGQVVVTDMLNRAMPLIRYRIGDVAAMLPVGKLGLPRLEIIAGRETDFVVTPDDRFVSGASLTLISAPGIAQLQYVQSLDGQLTVNYVKTNDCTPESLQELRSKITAVVGAGMQVALAEVNAIELLPSGKLQYVRSELARRRLALNDPVTPVESLTSSPSATFSEARV